MNERIARASPRFKARTAGAFWLMTMIMGAFAMFVGGRFVVSGDAAATAANILAHEPLFRLGVAADIIAAACYLAATLLVYDLLKPVSRNLSLLAAFFSLAGCAIGALRFLFISHPWSSWEARSTSASYPSQSCRRW